jgi:hypothetical protein
MLVHQLQAAEAEGAVAQTVGNLRLSEDDHREAVEAANEWGQKALATSRKGEEQHVPAGRYRPPVVPQEGNPAPGCVSISLYRATPRAEG